MIVVNFSTDSYIKGQQRLLKSLNGYPSLMLNNYSAIGSPSHRHSPYEFKIHAIDKALQKDDAVLWCDSSLWLVGDLKVIEDIILKDGYILTEAGHFVGRWINDFQRDYFKLTDDEVKQEQGGMTMFSAGFVGLYKHSPIAMEFFRQWKEAALDGCFQGDWETTRHDQSVGSIIASRLGMKYQRGGEHLAYIGPGYVAPEPSAIFYLQGLV